MRSIIEAVCYTLAVVQAKYPVLDMQLCRDVTFVTSEELIKLYPDKTAK